MVPEIKVEEEGRLVLRLQSASNGLGFRGKGTEFVREDGSADQDCFEATVVINCDNLVTVYGKSFVSEPIEGKPGRRRLVDLETGQMKVRHWRGILVSVETNSA